MLQKRYSNNISCETRFSEEDIKIWGRWSSEAFEIYAKKLVQTKGIIFEKIKKAILSSLNR